MPSPKERDSKEAKIIDFIKKAKYENDELAYNELYTYMKSYIDLFCKKFVIAGLGRDDIEQECKIALKYKAIDDFNPTRGKFKTFAVLCIKRHLFSIIKGNKQHKKIALNIAISLDESREDDGEEMLLKNLVASNEDSADEQVEKQEEDDLRHNKLMNKLSELEQEVYVLYVQKYHYEEISVMLKKDGRRGISRKTIDNAVQRVKSKSRELFKNEDFTEK